VAPFVAAEGLSLSSVGTPHCLACGHRILAKPQPTGQGLGYPPLHGGLRARSRGPSPDRLSAGGCCFPQSTGIPLAPGGGGGGGGSGWRAPPAPPSCWLPARRNSAPPLQPLAAPPARPCRSRPIRCDSVTETPWLRCGKPWLSQQPQPSSGSPPRWITRSSNLRPRFSACTPTSTQHQQQLSRLNNNYPLPQQPAMAASPTPQPPPIASGRQLMKHRINWDSDQSPRVCPRFARP